MYYTFILRLVTFHNPIKEFKAFLKTKKVKQLNVFKEYIENTFEKELKKSVASLMDDGISFRTN